MPTARARGDRGRDPACLLVAEQPALAGVRVEAGDCDASAGVAIETGERLEQERRSDALERLDQRLVHGRQRDLQVGSQKRHEVVAAVAFEAAAGGEMIGVTDEAGRDVSGDRGLRDRRGDHRVDRAGEREVDREIERRERAMGVGGAAAARRDGAAGAHRIDRGQRPGRHRRELLAPRLGGEPDDSLDQRRFDPPAERIDRRPLGDEQRPRAARAVGCERPQHDLGADPRRIALGQREDAGGGYSGSELSPPPLGAPVVAARRRERRSSSSLNR